MGVRDRRHNIGTRDKLGLHFRERRFNDLPLAARAPFDSQSDKAINCWVVVKETATEIG